jgi:NADH:ubiquinone oxidoreductase subunit 5 (subunit L)/multisubunit Na+/H+ antiporter MnhA subunit
MKAKNGSAPITLIWVCLLSPCWVWCFLPIYFIYMFWELVGVSSYLLIGFYYDKPSAVAACKKHLL